MHSAPLVLPKLTLDYLEPGLECVEGVQHWWGLRIGL